MTTRHVSGTIMRPSVLPAAIIALACACLVGATAQEESAGNPADGWVQDTAFGAPKAVEWDEDLDQDGLDHYQEFLAGTHPFVADSDEDGFWDGFEVTRGTDPTSPDSYPSSEVLGDVDCDGQVTAADIQSVINAALGQKVAVPTDLDGTGNVDSLDIQTVINAALLVP
ncbi:MAG: hypothetical protein HY706_17250 [Candidatus Hydrogenedentes bacterium]|nr:hypothetical protein [Candidatus Hydrogenedentota bacterium]